MHSLLIFTPVSGKKEARTEKLGKIVESLTQEGNELTANMPKNKPVITSITVDTYGVDYGEPETVEPFNYYDYLMQYYYGSSLSE